MQITPLNARVNASDLPIEQLSGNSSLTEQQKIGEVSRQFEALLLRQVLQNAQKTVFHSKLNPSSTAGSIYQDMVTNQMADNISKTDTFGLAKSLRQQLIHQTGAAAGSSANTTD